MFFFPFSHCFVLSHNVNVKKNGLIFYSNRDSSSSESLFQPSTYSRFTGNMDPHDSVFQLAKTGKAKQLKQSLYNRTKDERKRIVLVKLNGITSLIMSCKNGYLDVVEYLVDGCGANNKQTGLFNFEGENIEGAPPLDSSDVDKEKENQAR